MISATIWIEKGNLHGVSTPEQRQLDSVFVVAKRGAGCQVVYRLLLMGLRHMECSYSNTLAQLAEHHMPSRSCCLESFFAQKIRKTCAKELTRTWGVRTFQECSFDDRHSIAPLATLQ